MYDDCFYVEQKAFGTWQSFDKDGKGLVTSLHQETCVRATRYYLKLKQDGSINDSGVTYSSVVDGKL